MTGENSSLIRDTAILLAISVFLALAINYFHPLGFRFVSKKENRSLAFISVEEGRIKYDNGALFIDSRDPVIFGFSHIPGAVNIPTIPEEKSLERVNVFLRTMDRSRELVVYCDGEGCGSSEVLAERLFRAGYGRYLYILKEGLPGWRSAGYPVEESE